MDVIYRIQFFWAVRYLGYAALENGLNLSIAVHFPSLNICKGTVSNQSTPNVRQEMWQQQKRKEKQNFSFGSMIICDISVLFLLLKVVFQIWTLEVTFRWKQSIHTTPPITLALDDHNKLCKYDIDFKTECDILLHWPWWWH